MLLRFNGLMFMRSTFSNWEKFHRPICQRLWFKKNSLYLSFFNFSRGFKVIALVFCVPVCCTVPFNICLSSGLKVRDQKTVCYVRIKTLLMVLHYIKPQLFYATMLLCHSIQENFVCSANLSRFLFYITNRLWSNLRLCCVSEHCTMGMPEKFFSLKLTF
jgi:hypothetical protein